MVVVLVSETPFATNRIGMVLSVPPRFPAIVTLVAERDLAR